MRINLEPGGLGDELAVTLIPRALRDQKGEPYVCLGSGFKYPEIFLHHPWLDSHREGEKDLSLTHKLGWAERTLPRKFGKQAGVDVGYGPPEIFLSGDELSIDFSLPVGKCIVAVDTYSTWRTRRWPLENFGRVSEVLLRRGVVVVEVGRHRQKAIPSTRSYRNELTVRQTAALLSKCSLFLGNDSGLLHLSAAVGTPQVGIFGVVRAKRRAYDSTIPVESAEVCNRECRFRCADGYGDADGARCLSQIAVGDVLSAVASSIEKRVGVFARRA